MQSKQSTFKTRKWKSFIALWIVAARRNLRSKYCVMFLNELIIFFTSIRKRPPSMSATTLQISIAFEGLSSRTDGDATREKRTMHSKWVWPRDWPPRHLNWVSFYGLRVASSADRNRRSQTVVQWNLYGDWTNGGLGSGCFIASTAADIIMHTNTIKV